MQSSERVVALRVLNPDNIAARSKLGFAPYVAGLPATREMATTVMGQGISLPVLISLTGVQAVHPDGEGAAA
jgi:isopentenyl diphosphate isomerase/L-lactate dehydrogenase-like FMN-dependent dehydrogenase